MTFILKSMFIWFTIIILGSLRILFYLRFCKFFSIINVFMENSNNAWKVIKSVSKIYPVPVSVFPLFYQSHQIVNFSKSYGKILKDSSFSV